MERDLFSLVKEALGLALDPLRRELRPLPMILGGPTGTGDT